MLFTRFDIITILYPLCSEEKYIRIEIHKMDR